eukprot:gene31692-6896_t
MRQNRPPKPIASLTCASTGPLTVKDVDMISGSEGRDVFAEGKSLNLFQQKTLRVRRIYDAKHEALVYVAYSTRLSSATDDGGPSTGRYRTSICVLPLNPQPAPPVSLAPVDAPTDSDPGSQQTPAAAVAAAAALGAAAVILSFE